MRGIRLRRRKSGSDQGIKPKLSREALEGLVFLLNSVILLGLGATVLRLSDVANIYIERILIVAPDYAPYVGYGYVIGYAMLAFSIIQMLFSALKLYEAKAARRVELIFREVEDDAA